MTKHPFLVVAGYRAIGCTMLSLALDQVVELLETYEYVRMIDLESGKIYTYDSPDEAPVTRDIEDEAGNYAEDDDD